LPSQYNVFKRYCFLLLSVISRHHIPLCCRLSVNVRSCSKLLI